MLNKNKEILEYIERHKKEILSKWEELVGNEGYTLEKENVEKAMFTYKNWLEEEGFNCQIIDVGDKTAGTLVGIQGENRGGKPILFSGHIDTVYPKGSFGPDLFIIKDGNAHGPGVLDMKGGLIVALFVVKALKELGYDDTPIKFIVSGDEENGHQLSTGNEAFQKEAQNCLFGFNVETGRIDNKLCIGRKGMSNAFIKVTGVTSHAGNDFESGINSIEEMAHKIIDIQALTNLDTGTTVNVGVISGGTVPNAVPASCELKVDMRYQTLEEETSVKTKLKEIAAKTYVEGTTTEIEIVAGLQSFETTDQVMKFLDFIQTVAKNTDQLVPDGVYLGGGSDASNVGIAGTPAICAAGVLGQWNHTKDEYAVVQSMYDRIQLLTTVVLNQKQFN